MHRDYTGFCIFIHILYVTNQQGIPFFVLPEPKTRANNLYKQTWV